MKWRVVVVTVATVLVVLSLTAVSRDAQPKLRVDGEPFPAAPANDTVRYANETQLLPNASEKSGALAVPVTIAPEQTPADATGNEPFSQPAAPDTAPGVVF